MAALAIRIAYVEHTPYKAINDGGTYNRLGSMMARTGDYDTGSGAGLGRGRFARSDRLLPARRTRTSWPRSTSSRAIRPATSPRSGQSGSPRR